jgi:hypothetical protein
VSAQPQPAPEPDYQSLRDLIRAELERSPVPDPLSLTDSVMSMLSHVDYETAARYGVRTMLGEVSRQLRKTAMTTEPKPKGGKATTSSKWSAASAASKARPDLFAVRIVVGYDEHGKADYRLLGDCTRKHLRSAASLLRAHGDAQQASCYAKASQYEALSRHLRGAAKVRSLPLQLVESVVSDD